MTAKQSCKVAFKDVCKTTFHYSAFVGSYYECEDVRWFEIFLFKC